MNKQNQGNANQKNNLNYHIRQNQGNENSTQAGFVEEENKDWLLVADDKDKLNNSWILDSS